MALFLAVLFSLLAINSGAILHKAHAKSKVIQGCYFVKFSSDNVPQAEQIKSKLHASGAVINYHYKHPVFHALAACHMEHLVDALLESPAVEYIEPRQWMQPLALHNQGSKWLQTALHGNYSLWGLDRLDSAFQLNNEYYADNGGELPHIYILDTGSNFTDEVVASEFTDLTTGANRLVESLSFVTNDSNPGDVDGHGTHVCGTVGSHTYGVAKRARITNIKVLGPRGGDDADIIQAMLWAAEQSETAKIVSMSLGGGQTLSLDLVLNKLHEAYGVLFVVAAGNEYTDACETSPAGAFRAITVGASDINDHVASFSNWGDCVDIFAPGVSITSFGLPGKPAWTIDGTSMATPHVTGVAAMLWTELGATATNDDVAHELLRRAAYVIKGETPVPTVKRLLQKCPPLPNCKQVSCSGSTVVCRDCPAGQESTSLLTTTCQPTSSKVKFITKGTNVWSGPNELYSYYRFNTSIVSAASLDTCPNASTLEQLAADGSSMGGGSACDPILSIINVGDFTFRIAPQDAMLSTFALKFDVQPIGELKGCFDDDINSPEYSVEFQSSVLTPMWCYTKCTQQLTAYKYYAVQNGNTCFCGNSYGAYGVNVFGNCDFGFGGVPCTGDSRFTCGGGNAHVVYAIDACPEYASGAPTCSCNYGFLDNLVLNTTTGKYSGVCTAAPCPANATQVVSAESAQCECSGMFHGDLVWDGSARVWTGACDLVGIHMGCYADDSIVRDLPVLGGTSSNMDAALCYSLCGAYAFYGLQGTNCYCGNTYGRYGNSTCGALANSVYSRGCAVGCAQCSELVAPFGIYQQFVCNKCMTGWSKDGSGNCVWVGTSAGCYAMPGSSALASGELLSANYSSSNSPGQCAYLCRYYAYFAVQGERCYCATALSVFTQKYATNANKCPTQCPGDHDYFCGGTQANALSVYQRECTTNCDVCYTNGAGATRCSICSRGYYASDQGFCLACPPECSECTSPVECQGCTEGYLLSNSVLDFDSAVDTAFTCLDCAANCSACAFRLDLCVTCQDGYYPDVSNVQPISSSSSAIDFSVLVSVCLECSANCTTCSKANTCLTCPSGYYVDISSLLCLECDAECVECDVLSSRCTSCPSGLTLTADHTCRPGGGGAAASVSPSSLLLAGILLILSFIKSC